MLDFEKKLTNNKIKYSFMHFNFFYYKSPFTKYKNSTALERNAPGEHK